MHRSIKNKKGFTLTELLFVIAIIMALVAMLMPALKAARDQTNRIKCASNLRQLGLGLNSYAVENSGSLPIGYDQYKPINEGYWFKLLSPYVGAPLSLANTDNTKTVFTCPSHDVKQIYTGYGLRLSYGVVDAFKTGGGVIIRFGRNSAAYPVSQYPPLRFGQFTKPGEVALLGENNNYYTFNYWMVVPYGSDGDWPLNGYIKWHHKSHMNFLFADGHVEPLTRTNFLSRALNNQDKFMYDY